MLTTFGPDQILPIIGDPVRYRILGVLRDGQPHSAAELGRFAIAGRISVGRQLSLLRTAGLIEPCASPRDRRTRCHRLRPALIPRPDAPEVIDLGCCTLRFSPPAPLPPAQPAPAAAPVTAPRAPASRPLPLQGDFA